MSADNTAITVLIADDQPLERTGNALILDSADDIEVIAQAATGEEAIALARTHRPDVVLMDVRMPGIGGLHATRIITQDVPTAKVVVLTTFDLDEYAFGALRAGASAFLLKSTKPDTLIDAVRTVHNGTAVVDPRLTKQLIDHFLDAPAVHDEPDLRADALDQLTPRELDIFTLIARGLTNTEIGDELHLAPSTVKSYINTLFAKLDVRDRVHAVLLAHNIDRGSRP
ncbi:MAG: response regulator transcription factor [Microbacterium sp.]